MILNTEKFSDEPGPGPQSNRRIRVLADILRSPERRREAGPRGHGPVWWFTTPILRKRIWPGPTTQDLGHGMAPRRTISRKHRQLAPDDPDVMLTAAVFAIIETHTSQAQELPGQDRWQAPRPTGGVLSGWRRLASARNSPTEASTAVLEQGVEKASDTQAILPMLLEFSCRPRFGRGQQDVRHDGRTRILTGFRSLRAGSHQIGRGATSGKRAAGLNPLARPSLARGPLAAAYLPQPGIFCWAVVTRSLGIVRPATRGGPAGFCNPTRRSSRP